LELELLLELELEFELEFELELELELLLELLLEFLLWLELELLLWLELELLLWLELELLEAGATEAGATARASLAAGLEWAPRMCGGLAGGAFAIRCGSAGALRAMRAFVGWSSSERPNRGLNAEPTAMPSAPRAPA
jgi:hypothetical protein